MITTSITNEFILLCWLCWLVNIATRNQNCWAKLERLIHESNYYNLLDFQTQVVCLIILVYNFFFLRANLKDELLIFRYKIILFNISGCWIYAVKVEKIRKNIFVFISQITNVVWFTFFACFVLFLVLFFFRLITQYSKIMRFI